MLLFLPFLSSPSSLCFSSSLSLSIPFSPSLSALALPHPLWSSRLSFVFPSSLRSLPAVRPAEPSSIHWSFLPQKSDRGYGTNTFSLERSHIPKSYSHTLLMSFSLLLLLLSVKLTTSQVFTSAEVDVTDRQIFIKLKLEDFVDKNLQQTHSTCWT